MANPTGAHQQPGEQHEGVEGENQTTASRFDQSRREQDELFRLVERAKREWEATADALSELICLVDARGTVRRANQTVERWGLSTVQEAPGRQIHELLHPGCAGCFIQQSLTRAMSGDSDTEVNLFETHDARLEKDVEIGVYPVTGEEDEAGYSVIVVRDVTARREADEALKRYANRLALMNEITQSILAARSSEQIVQATLAQLRRLLPYREGHVILLDAEGSGASHFNAGSEGPVTFSYDPEPEAEPRPSLCLRDEDEVRIVANAATLLDDDPLKWRALNKGFEAWTCVTLNVEGKRVGWMTLGFSEAGQIGPELVPFLRDIGDLLAIASRQAQLRASLQAANVALRHANQAKDELIQNVSHELRTPLAIISGYAELLLGGVLGAITNDQSEALEIVTNQNERLRHMVDLLLSLQTVEISRLNKSKVDPASIIDLAQRSWQVKAREQQMHLIDEAQPGLGEVELDVRMFEHVIYNLLDNAVKFGKVGGNIALSTEVKDGRYHIIVADDGIGIPLGNQSRIFERFYQADSQLNRSTRGMGLGLAYCRKIVAAHGGEMWMESAGKDMGCTFYVALPLAEM